MLVSALLLCRSTKVPSGQLNQELWELFLSPQAAAHHAGYQLPEEGHATTADGPGSAEVVRDKMTAANKISKNNIF